MAAVIPGLIAMTGYMLVIKILVTLDPKAGPAGQKHSWTERLKATVVVEIVGIYGGWANPTEAAFIGAAACGILAVITGGLRWKGIKESLMGTAYATAMIFMVLLGADLLNSGLAITQLPTELA